MKTRLIFAGLILLATGATCKALVPIPVDFLVISPDGNMVAANVRGVGTVTVFDLHARKAVKVLDAMTAADRKAYEAALPDLTGTGSIEGLAFSPDGRFLSCEIVGEDAVIVWDLRHDFKAMRIKAQDFAECGVLGFSKDSKRIITLLRARSNDEDFLVARDTQTGAEIWRKDLGQDERVTVGVSPEMDVVTESDDTGSRRYRTLDGKLADTTKTDAEAKAKPPAFTLMQSGKKIEITETISGAKRAVEAADAPSAVALAQNKLVVAEVGDGLQVWDAATGKHLFDIGDLTPPMSGLFSNDPSPNTGLFAPATNPATTEPAKNGGK